MDPFGENVDLNEDFNISDNENSNSILPKNKTTLILIFVILIILTIGILILVFFVLDINKNKPYEENENPGPNPNPYKPSKNNSTISGEINCKYSIKELNISIPLLSKKFENNNSIIDIYINHTKKEYNKEYQFPSTGVYDVKFTLNSIIIMDNMFKDIKNIISIESMYIYSNSKLLPKSLEDSYIDKQLIFQR